MDIAVGFDLDMTLLDTRRGIAATYRELVARTGVPVDVELVVSRLGPPLRDELANWFPPADVPAAIELYRSLYPAYAIEPTAVLPGAVAAFSAVREAGGRIAVVTSKLGRLAELHLAHARLEVDAVYGDVFAEGKAPALTDFGATVYVGDHVADMRAGVVAGAYPVGVESGPCSRVELLDAGAAAVIDSLVELPPLLAERGLLPSGR